MSERYIYERLIERVSKRQDRGAKDIREVEREVYIFFEREVYI